MNACNGAHEIRDLGCSACNYAHEISDFGHSVRKYAREIRVIVSKTRRRTPKLGVRRLYIG